MELTTDKDKLLKEPDEDDEELDIQQQTKQEPLPINESKEFINLELPNGIKFACGTSRPEFSVFNLLDILNWFLKNYDSLIKKEKGNNSYLG